MKRIYSSEFASLFVQARFWQPVVSLPKFRLRLPGYQHWFWKDENPQDHQQLSFNTLDKGIMNPGFL